MDLPSESVQRAIKNLHASYSHKSNTSSVQDTQPFIQTELARRINLRFLCWVNRIWSGSHLVRAHLFPTSLADLSLLSSGKPSRYTLPRLLKAFCAADAGRQKRSSSFLPKKRKEKNVSFEVFYLLFFIVADYDTDCFHCAKSARCFASHWLQSLICVSDIVERSTALTHTYKTKTKHWLCSLLPCCATQICFLFIRCIVDYSFFMCYFIHFLKQE